MKKLRSILMLLILTVGPVLIFSACQKEEIQLNSIPSDYEEKTATNMAANLANKPKKVMLAQHPTLGKYLADQDGRTLYISTRDIIGNSTCLTRCLGQWPVFETKRIKVSRELNASDFAVITRPDGRQQVTFKGWPLYYFSGDTQAGDINGDGVDNAGFVAKPDYTLMLADQALEAFGSALTRYLTDASGRTLYFFLQDPGNGSVCYDDCIASWPAFTSTGDLHFPSSLDGSRFSVIERTDGKKQLAYLGMPLYYFAEDAKRAEAKGQLIEDWTVAHLNW